MEQVADVIVSTLRAARETGYFYFFSIRGHLRLVQDMGVDHGRAYVFTSEQFVLESNPA